MIAIYPYKKTYSDELKWSIESLKNVDIDGVLVVGETDLDVPQILPEENSWAIYSPYSDVMNRILSANIDGDFLLMNDDFFILDKWTPETYDKGTLVSHLSALSPTNYSSTLRRTLSFLRSRNLPTLSYETHTPMVMNYQKLLDLWKLVEYDYISGTPHALRSLYGNFYSVPSRTIQDVKNPANYTNKILISTNEQTFGGELGEYIMSVISGVKPPKRKKYTVSVIVPVYNQPLIEKCLQSIPNHPQIKEIIVCDDCSADGTRELVKKDPRVKLLVNDKNIGVGETVNKLLDTATGDYVLRIDSDDHFLNIEPVLEQMDGTDIIYYSRVRADGRLEPLNPSTRRQIVAPSHLIRREFIGETRNNGARWGEDRDFIYKLHAKNPTELFTGITAYFYNYPRKGSLMDLHAKKNPLGLNIFTNCTPKIKERQTIFETYQSFIEAFGEPAHLNIYIDPNPNPTALKAYSESLQASLPHAKVYQTKGLADGYSRSLENAKTDYIFQLEHDWVFHDIKHSMPEIVKLMQNNDLWYLRFNKMPNEHVKWLDKWETVFEPKNGYCLTDNISNNPHILRVDYYKENILPKLDSTAKGSLGIEQNLEARGIIGAMYGGFKHPATVTHIDGAGSGYA